jgi:aminopeptidase-like protein
MIIEMEYEMKLNILSRFFYYIEQAKDIPFYCSSYDEQSLCYFVANRYINENKADDLIQALIDTNDDDYIKAIRDYVQYTALNEVREKYEDR